MKWYEFTTDNGDGVTEVDTESKYFWDSFEEIKANYGNA